MSSSLPFTVQDDIQQKEKYAATQQKNSSRNCNSRRLRLWILIIIVSLSTLGLVTYFGKSGTSAINYGGIFDDDDIHAISDSTTALADNNLVDKPAPILKEEPKVKKQEEPQSLKDKILQRIKDNQLIVFSKTYCPFSMKAKRILSSYKLKESLPVIEVDLRDDDYQVKMVLKEISGRETFPNIFLNGKSLGGSDDLEELHETGQLQILLAKSDLILV